MPSSSRSSYWHGQDRSADGGGQCCGADVDEPVVVAAEHFHYLIHGLHLLLTKPVPRQDAPDANYPSSLPCWKLRPSSRATRRIQGFDRAANQSARFSWSSRPSIFIN